MYFLYSLKNPFGYNPSDALSYLHYAEYGLNHSFDEFISYLQSRNTQIADYGFPFIRFFVFNLAGSVDAGILLMVIVNAVSVTLGALYLYKLSLFFLPHNCSKVVFLFWGLNTCAIVINVMGCKESIFTTLLIIAMYQLCYSYRKKDIFHLVLAIIFVGLTMFFRIWLTAFFTIIILLRPLYSRISTYFALFAVVALTLITAFLGLYISTAFPVLSILLSTQQIKSSLLFINMLTGFLGPYPNLLQNYLDPNSLFWSPYSAFKVLFSFFAIYGAWHVLKHRVIKLYPLFLFVFFNILLVVGTVRAFDYRFSYTMIPFFFIFAVYGFNHFKFNGRFKYRNIFLNLYYVAIFLLVFNYNIR
jgi:hypothetical protein